MSEIVSYCCASCGGGAKKVIGDTFDCTFCGNTNKIINEKDVISFKSKNTKKLSIPDSLKDENKGMSTASKIILGVAIGIVAIGVLKHISNKRRR